MQELLEFIGRRNLFVIGVSGCVSLAYRCLA